METENRSVIEGNLNTTMENEINISIADLNHFELMTYLPLTISLVIIMIIGIIGNITVIYVYKWKIRRSGARVYILSLAMTDLTVSVVGLPYHVLDLTFLLTYTYTYVCKILTFFITIGHFSSVFLLVLIGFDRYLKVCRPLKKQIVDFGDRKACMITVFIAVLINVPNLVLYGHSSVETGINNLTGTECFIDDTFQGSTFAFGYVSMTLIVSFLCALLLIILYAFIIRAIYQSGSTEEINLHDKRGLCFCCVVKSNEKEGTSIKENKSTKSDNKQTGTKYHSSAHETSLPRRRETMTRHISRKTSKAEDNITRKITLMMMTITLVFIITILPVFIISIFDILDETLWDADYDILIVYDFLLRMYLVNNAANPIIYSFWDVNFRNEVRKLFKNIMCQGPESRNTPISNSQHSTSGQSVHTVELSIK